VPLPTRIGTPAVARLASGVLAVALALAGCGGSGAGAPADSPVTPTTAAAVSKPVLPAGLHDPGRPIPSTFLGLSFEAADLGLIARSADHGNLANLLRSIAAHGVLRIGGTTADGATAWTSDGQRRPAWATASVTPADLAAVGRLSAETGWQVLLTVNLGHFDPSAAAAEAAAAHAALGRNLIGIEIGNEPERFVPHGLRDPGWGSRAYRTQVDSYRAAIDRAVPGLALAGPDAVSLAGSLGWVDREAAWEHPTLLTAHYYPLGRCGSYVPTIATLLSAAVRQAQARMFDLADKVARTTGIPMRVDESNNVACGGQPDVSDTFAAALWATDYLGRAMASQVTGVNLHGLLSNPEGYAPIAFASAAARHAGELSADPELYALLLVRHLIGDRAVQSSLAPPALDGSVRVFLRPDGGLDVLAVNDALSADEVLRLPLPSHLRRVSVWRLRAPGPSARSGVRLAGRAVAADGSFVAPAAVLPIRVAGRALLVTLPADSAAIIALRVGAAPRS